MAPGRVIKGDLYLSVIPAQAGIQLFDYMGSRLRTRPGVSVDGNDVI